MDDLAAEERQKYEELWNSFPEYRKESPADFLTPIFLYYFRKQIHIGDAVIDFGCGPGRSASHLLQANLKVFLVDLCDHCLDPDLFLKTVGPKPLLSFFQATLWALPPHLEPAEWILCFDVLEHLPEEKINTALKAMASRMHKGGFLSVALQEDQFGALIGKKLHLTVKPKKWWRDRIQRHFIIEKEFSEENSYAVFVKRRNR